MGVPGCFRHSWGTFLFGVSLDACVVAGSTFSFLSFSFLPPLPPLPFSRAACLQANKASATGFLMRFGLSSVCPLSFGPPFIGPYKRHPFFSFMSFCLHVSSSSSFRSLARTFVRTLACTHTRTRILLTTRFRWPRFVAMRFGSSVVPLHLVLLHRQPHTLFVCLRGVWHSRPTTRNEAVGESGKQPCAPAPLFRKTGGNGTRHTCVSVPFLLFPVVYSIGLQLGPQPCNVDLQPNSLASTH